MSTFVKKLTNISKNTISIILVGGNIVQVVPQGILENIEIKDLSGISNWVKVELGRVNLNETL